MRHASKLGVGIVAVLAGWILVASARGQQLGTQAPPVKKGHLIVAGPKEYEMLAELFEVEGKFRSFDPDTSILKVRVEYEHAEKEHKDEFDRNQKTYKDTIQQLTTRLNNLQNEHRQAMARARTNSDKQNAQNNYNSQMQSLNNDKRNADQQYKDALNKLGMVRDFIDYELPVAKDAPIRKMWAPKLFDDKGKVRSMTTEERPRYKGPVAKQVGWTTKLEVFEVNTHVKVQLKPAAGEMKDPEPEPEPVNSQTLPTTTTTSAEFKAFDSPAGRFSVLMPGAPKEVTQNVPTPAGQIQVTAFTAELSGTTYVAAFSDMPKGFITDANRETFYDGTIKGVAQVLQGTVLSTNKARLGNQDGREAVAKIPPGIFVRMRICAVGDRMYQAQVLGPESAVKSDDATRFLDSFKMLSGKRQEVKLDDRPVVKMVIAEFDPNAPPPAPPKQPTIKKKY